MTTIKEYHSLDFTEGSRGSSTVSTSSSVRHMSCRVCDPGYMSTKKFRTNEFDEWNKRSFDSCNSYKRLEPSCLHELHSQNFRLFRSWNLSESFWSFVFICPRSWYSLSCRPAPCLYYPRRPWQTARVVWGAGGRPGHGRHGGPDRRAWPRGSTWPSTTTTTCSDTCTSPPWPAPSSPAPEKWADLSHRREGAASGTVCWCSYFTKRCVLLYKADRFTWWALCKNIFNIFVGNSKAL